MTRQLPSIIYYRAISILLIAIGHCLNLAHLFPDSLPRQLFSNFIVGATTLFVFISGYLFHHVFYSKFKFVDFLKGRLARIAIPYLVLAIPSIFVLHTFNQFGTAEITRFGSILATGNLYWIYWYIPFICLTFCLAPLHVRFISLAMRVQLLIVVCLIAVSMLGHRPIDNLSPWHSAIYFAPVYLVGIFVSQHRQRLLRLMEGREFYLLAIALGMVGVQTAAGQMKNSHKAFLEYQGFDLMFLNKLLFALALFFLLERFGKAPSALTKLIASTSFAIFFIHPILIKVLICTNSFPITGQSWIDLALASGFIVTVAILLAVIVKAIFGHRSRYLLGY